MILELFTREVCIFLKKQATSIISVCLSTNISYISGAHYSKSKWCYNAKPSTSYFYVRTKISVNFQIYISVRLLHFTEIIIYLQLNSSYKIDTIQKTYKFNQQTELLKTVPGKNPPGKKPPVTVQGQGQGQVRDRVRFRV